MVRRGSSVTRPPDRVSAIERIIDEGDGRLFSLVHRNDLKRRPAAIDDREAGALSHPLDHQVATLAVAWH